MRHACGVLAVACHVCRPLLSESVVDAHRLLRESVASALDPAKATVGCVARWVACFDGAADDCASEC